MPGDALERFLLQVDAPDVGDSLPPGIEATLVSAIWVATGIVCDVVDFGLNNVRFEVGCGRDGADLHEGVLGICGVFVFSKSDGEGSIKEELGGPLWHKFTRRNGSRTGDVLFSNAYICCI
jgi:hypothetical protein